MDPSCERSLQIIAYECCKILKCIIILTSLIMCIMFEQGLAVFHFFAFVFSFKANIF